MLNQKDLDGAKIAMFYDPGYVFVEGTQGPPNDNAHNLKISLESLSHTVHTF